MENKQTYAEVGRIFGWSTFTIKGVRFLAYDKGTSVGIINSECDNYGAYYSVKSFRENYAKRGESLNLTKGTTP